MADSAQSAAGPRARYDADLERDDFVRDPAQEKAVDALQSIHEALLDNPTSKSLFGKSKREPVKGLYLWGGVGRGKTYLMDCFFENLPFEEKSRLHFHRFMQKVHEARKKYANKSDPLKLIAKELQPVGNIFVRRVDFDDITPYPEFASLEAHVVALILNSGETAQKS